MCKTMYTYAAYGLIISSELQLNGLNEVESNNFDISIEFGDVPAEISNPVVKSPYQQISNTEYLLEISEVAKFCVTNGKLIIIQKEINCHQGDIQVFLMGTVFAYVLQYHNYLVLHASAVIFNDKAVIFSGSSGSGKSTIAAALAKKGFVVLTDDMAAININSNGELVLIPGWPRLKLWRDALDVFGEKTDYLTKVQNKQDKYEFPIDSSNIQAVQISHFYELIPDDGDTVRINLLEDKLHGLNLLVKNTFRYHMLRGLNKHGLHFRQCAAMADKIKFALIKRPKIGYKLAELLQLICLNLK